MNTSNIFIQLSKDDGELFIFYHYLNIWCNVDFIVCGHSIVEFVFLLVVWKWICIIDWPFPSVHYWHHLKPGYTSKTNVSNHNITHQTWPVCVSFGMYCIITDITDINNRILYIYDANNVPDSKVHGANMGPIWGRQDPGGLRVGPMNLAIWGCLRLIKQHMDVIFMMFENNQWHLNFS